MATTQNTFTGDGSTTNYSFTFEYIKEADVKATLDGTATTAFTLANATTLSFNTAPANGVAIRIFRDTDINSLKATFFPGSAIKAEDLNDNFTQNNFAVQEADFNVDTANATADTAKTNSETAVATANTASTNATAAVATANTADTNASAAVATANTASTNASNAVSTANAASTTANSADANATLALNNSRESDGQGGYVAAITKANTAIATANTASTNATTAVNTANAATTTANTASTNASNAVTTANSAAADATSAVSTANTASTNATNAVTTANSAAADATSAVATANTASTNASNAVTTANTADTNATAALNNSRESDGQGGFTSAISKANTAITTANTATAAVSNAVLFDLIANVAAIPGSPSNNDYIEIADSTGIQNFTPLSGLPSGFVGAAGLTVRLRYDSSGTTWAFMNYFANDSETRYVAIGNPNPVYYANQAAFPSATTYHGGIAHSHADGAMYYAHGGNWIKMASESDVAANTSSIATNTTNIGTNTTNIGTNTTDIASQNTRLGTAEADIITLVSAVNTKFPTAGGTFSGNVEVGTGIDLNTSGDATFNGNIGVGQASPQNRIQLTSSGANPAYLHSTNASSGVGGNDGVVMGLGNATDVYYWNYEAGNQIWATNGTERMRLDSLGKLGIGTTSPSQILELKAAEPRLCLNGTTVNNQKGIEFEHNGTRFGSLFQNANSGEMCLSSGDNGSGYYISFKTNTAERLRITQTGDVGIGTTSPAAKLHVAGNAEFDNNVHIKGNYGAGGTASLSGMTGLLTFDLDYSDTARGPNKVVSYNDGSTFVCGLGVHSSTAAYYSGSKHTWYKSNSQTSFSQVLDLDASGNLTAAGSISGTSVGGAMIATQAEAEAGTNNDQIMTPLRVAQAIAAQGGSVIQSIQRGTTWAVNWPSSATRNQTISSVDTAKSMVLFQGQTFVSTSLSLAFARVQLTSSTTVAVTGSQMSTSNPTVGWEVVEFK